MKNNNILKVLISFLFIVFLVIFLSGQTGYYEYTNNNKAVFTEEKIKEFEKDVESGKNVNIKDYLIDNTKDYSNKITDFGDDLSEFVSATVCKVLNGSFKIMEKMIN